MLQSNRSQIGVLGAKMKMDVISAENGITKLVLTGSMNIQGALDVEPRFNEIVKTTDKIIVDLKDVSFLTSLGMRVLVMSARALRERGGKLVLANPQTEVERVMKIAGIDTVIDIAPDLSTAIALFR
jgi:anti-anti-sigma factor